MNQWKPININEYQDTSLDLFILEFEGTKSSGLNDDVIILSFVNKHAPEISPRNLATFLSSRAE